MPNYGDARYVHLYCARFMRTTYNIVKIGTGTNAMQVTLEDHSIGFLNTKMSNQLYTSLFQRMLKF